jgi:hypothetical protein
LIVVEIDVHYARMPHGLVERINKKLEQLT